MERFNFRRMGMMALLGLIGAAKADKNKALENMARAAFGGGYRNSAHGWSGKRRKVKGWQRPGGAQNRRAERRARA